MAVLLTCGVLGCETQPPDAGAGDGGEAEAEGRVDHADAAFQVGLWPGEGRPVLAASDTILVLRSSPSDTSAVAARLSPTPGEEVAFGETVYRTVRPGTLLVLRVHALTGRSFGPVDAIPRDGYYAADVARGEWAVMPGDTLALLQHRAEGTCFVRSADAVLEADSCPTLSPGAVRVVSEPVTEWWVRVDAPDGRSGWARVGSGVTETGRRF